MIIKFDEHAKARFLEIDLDADNYVQLDILREDGIVRTYTLHLFSNEMHCHELTKADYANLSRDNIDNIEHVKLD